MNVGFIGTGSMGSILIDSLVRSGALRAEHVLASNRTREKAEKLAALHPGLRIADSNREVAESCRLIFLCIKPSEFVRVLKDIKPVLTSDQLIVSITSPVLIHHLEDAIPCKIAKIIPSITNDVLSGATLCIYGSRIEMEDRLLLERLTHCISRPIEVDESHTRISSDLTSCGPAFFSFLLQKFIDAAAEATGISHSEATQMASEMLLGTGTLLTTGGYTPETLQAKVAVPGGITQEGLRLMDREIKDVFHQLIAITHAKYEEDVDKVEEAFRAAFHENAKP